MPGCGSGGETTETLSADDVILPRTSPPTTVDRPARTIQSIEQEVSRIRGLPIKNEIAVSYLNRDQLRQEMKAQVEKEYRPAELASEEKALKGIGLMDPSDDLAADIEQMLGEEIAGYYDDQTKQLKLVSDKPELNPMNQVTLAHEVTHALQDQNFSLATVMPENSGNDDRDLALLALVEGDATLAEEEFTTANFNAMDMLSLLFGSLGAITGLGNNAYLEDSLLFPYSSGLEYVTALKDQGGWRAVDMAYAKPPQSTEQVMHPEKYFIGEAPVPVMIPDLAVILGPDWQPGFENVLGEFELVELLSRDISAARARRAAAGWAGDAIRYYDGPGGSSLIIMKLEWDSEAEAAEFATAMGEALERRYDGKFDLKSTMAPVLQTSEGVWELVQRGNTVEAVWAPDLPIGEKVVQSLR